MDVEWSGSESHDLVPEDNGVHETFEFGNVLTEMDFPSVRGTGNCYGQYGYIV